MDKAVDWRDEATKLDLRDKAFIGGDFVDAVFVIVNSLVGYAHGLCELPLGQTQPLSSQPEAHTNMSIYGVRFLPNLELLNSPGAIHLLSPRRVNR